jgi:hypothetical protein
MNKSELLKVIEDNTCPPWCWVDIVSAVDAYSAALIAAKPNVIGSANEKPTMQIYGWHEQCGFDDEPSGWMIEGGEEAYYEALKKWKDAQ